MEGEADASRKRDREGSGDHARKERRHVMRGERQVLQIM